MTNLNARHALLLGLTAFLAILIATSLTTPLTGGNKSIDYTWRQNSYQEISKGETNNLIIPERNDDAYLTLKETPPISTKKIISSDNPKENFSLKNDKMKKGGNGKNHISEEISRQNKIKSLSFYLKITDDMKKVETSLISKEGKKGPVLTTSLSRNGKSLSGMLIADDGEEGKPITDVGYGNWMKIRIENINYSKGEYNLIVQEGAGAIKEKNISFFDKTSQNIQKASFRIGGDVDAKWIPLKINDKPWYKSSENDEETQKDPYVGTYTSTTLNMKNRISPNEDIQKINYQKLELTGTKKDKIKVQIAYANKELELRNKEFVGPDGTENTYYKKSTINLTQPDNHKVLKYKIYIEGTPENSPTVSKIEIPYTVEISDGTKSGRKTVSYKEDL